MNERLLADLKEYLRIDGDDENTSLSLFLEAAILHLENAGVSQPSDYYLKVGDVDVYAQHRLAIHLLATHFYENRNVINPTSIKVAQIPIPYGLQSLILQLKWVCVE
ncbi:head-tail connector protein [Viridibacillus sp. FSL R5-0468]|uniref:head-tail connector protein n=1 Tax=Viridibacillus sp. FSL R5-0468 TaxID=2921640 RepID=UPI0030FBF3EE